MASVPICSEFKARVVARSPLKLSSLFLERTGALNSRAIGFIHTCFGILGRSVRPICILGALKRGSCGTSSDADKGAHKGFDFVASLVLLHSLALNYVGAASATILLMIELLHHPIYTILP